MNSATFHSVAAALLVVLGFFRRRIRTAFPNVKTGEGHFSNLAHEIRLWQRNLTVKPVVNDWKSRLRKFPSPEFWAAKKWPGYPGPAGGRFVEDKLIVATGDVAPSACFAFQREVQFFVREHLPGLARNPLVVLCDGVRPIRRRIRIFRSRKSAATALYR